MSEVAIIGTGNVGAGLGRRLTESGLAVVYGARNGFEASMEAGGARVMSVGEAIEAATVVFVAIPGHAVVEFAREHAPRLEGKILVDATNPMKWDDGPVWSPPPQGSNAQALAELTGATVVKGFNGFGSEFHENPELGGGERAEVFLAGPREAADRVGEIARQAGFRPTYAGPLRNAAVLENAAMLWIHLALAEKHGRNFVIQRVNRA